MAYDIGAKIGISGWQEFRTQINEINKNYKSLTDYSAALTKRMDAEGKSIDSLNLKKQVQERQMSLLESKYEKITEALDKAKLKYSDNSTAVMRLEGALFDVRNSMTSLEAEISDTERAMQNLEMGIDDVSDAAEDAGGEVLTFGDALKAGIASGAILNVLEQVGDVIVDIGSQTVEAAAEVKAANAQFSQTFGDLEGTATSALRAISDETGIAVTRLQGGYTALYAFTKSVGGDADTALNIAQRALTAAADSAAYYDRTMEDATETLQSFLKGNYENDAALGIAATETTRNAKANELYAKSFKDLTEAQKVDTLLAMVEAGNAASGALGQAAREADSWANVTGELQEAWRQLLATIGGPVLQGLTPLLQGITGAINEMTAPKSWETLNASIDGMQAAFQNASEALAETQAQIDANASLAERYVDRLRELEGAGLDTAEAQREYAQTVELLNGVMPELGLTINEVTGRLDQNTWAIEDNITALKEQARRQAQQAQYQEKLDAYTAAYQELYAAETRLNELLARQAVLLEQGAVAHESYSYAQAGSVAALDSLNPKLSEQDKELAQVNYEITALSGAYRTATEAVSAAETELDTFSAAMDSQAGSAQALANAVEQIPPELEALETAYNDAKTAARESIDQQIGLFDKVSQKSTISAEKIVKNWKSQKSAFSNYSDNLQKAVDMGLDEALVLQLSDGSEQSMQILNELLNGTELTVDEINAAFQGMDQAKTEVSGTMAELQITIDDAYAEMSAAAREAGYDIVDGAVQGIRDNIYRYEAVMRQMGNRGQAAYRESWSTHSPSRVMSDISDDIVDGGVNQFYERIHDMERAMADLAAAGRNAYLQEQLDYAAAYPSMVAGTPGFGGGTTTNNRSVAYGGISITINAQPGQDAQGIADAVLQELTVRLGQEEAAFG